MTCDRPTSMNTTLMNYRNIITIEPGKRSGKPCIRRMRITVYDVLGWLASGMSQFVWRTAQSGLATL